MKSLEQGVGTSVHVSKVKPPAYRQEEDRLGSQVEAKARSRSEDTKKHGGEDM